MDPKKKTVGFVPDVCYVPWSPFPVAGNRIGNYSFGSTSDEKRMHHM